MIVGRDSDAIVGLEEIQHCAIDGTEGYDEMACCFRRKESEYGCSRVFNPLYIRRIQGQLGAPHI